MYERTLSKLIIVVTMLNVSLINVVSIKSINYNITINTLICTYICVSILKINIHPICCILDALHELTPELASQWPTQKPYENLFSFSKRMQSAIQLLQGG